MTSEERALLGLPCIRVRIRVCCPSGCGYNGKEGWFVTKSVDSIGATTIVELSDNERMTFLTEAIEFLK
jgi:hypothetical protein